MVKTQDISGTQQIGSYYWPERDKTAPLIVLRESAKIPLYLKHCQRRGVCIQAGGNCGVYAQILAHYFKQVFTFEPDLENWKCLNINVTAKNVTKSYAALGNAPGKVETWRTEKDAANYGATMVRSANEGVDIVRVDDLGLSGLDFFMLDVEGFELPALQGAKQTIIKFKPTIAVEIKGLGQHHGYTDNELMAWLTGISYNETTRIGRDVIFTPSA